MADDDTTNDSEAYRNGALQKVSRRDALRRTATTAAIGVVGTTAGFTGTAAADSYQWQESETHQLDEGHTLTCSTELGYSHYDAQARRHNFNFVTASDFRLQDDPEVNIYDHKITIDCCKNGLVPDISENETGTVPPKDFHNQPDSDLFDLATIAFGNVSGLIGGTLDSLEALKAASGLVSGNHQCSGNTSKWSVNRFWDGDLAVEPAVKTQCEFDVELPVGTDVGQVLVKSYTLAHVPSLRDYWVENVFDLTVYDDSWDLDAHLSWKWSNADYVSI